MTGEPIDRGAGGASITVSVVSHRQNALVNLLIDDLRRLPAPPALLITQNTPDPGALATAGYPAQLRVMENSGERGFGANHNRAFQHCRTPYFCVVNPDVRIESDPFPTLLEALRDPGAAVAGPLVRAADGQTEDSARRFPTLRSLAAKLLSPRRGPDYDTSAAVQDVDWVAGMFMVFRSEAFRDVGGFDERYFLYYEDVDICRRLRQSARTVRYVTTAAIVHGAQRASRRSPRLAYYHLASALRYLGLGRRSARSPD